MIKLQAFGYDYDQNKVFRDINMEINEGKVYVLIGKNGSGKSTFLKCLNYVLEDYRGVITVDEKSLLIEDNPILFEYLTGREYINLVSQYVDVSKQKNFQQLVVDIDLEKELDKHIIDYSLGTKHKIALITALMMDYKIILIDEPLRSLDPYASKTFINFIRELKKKGTTIIVSTNIMSPAYEMADKVLLINNRCITEVENDFNSFEEFKNYADKVLIENLTVSNSE